LASSRKFAVLHTLGENWSLFIKDLLIVHSLVNATILTPRKEEDDVAVNLTQIASFAIMDVLPFTRESNFEIPIKQLSSPLTKPTIVQHQRNTGLYDEQEY
jgi:hypothetical protein